MTPADRSHPLTVEIAYAKSLGCLCDARPTKCSHQLARCQRRIDPDHSISPYFCNGCTHNREADVKRQLAEVATEKERQDAIERDAYRHLYSQSPVEPVERTPEPDISKVIDRYLDEQKRKNRAPYIEIGGPDPEPFIDDQKWKDATE